MNERWFFHKKSRRERYAVRDDGGGEGGIRIYLYTIIHGLWLLSHREKPLIYKDFSK